MSTWLFWLPVLVAGLVAGGSSGLMGTYLVGGRIPLLGVCIAHAALAGAVLGALFGVPTSWLTVPALLVACLCALGLGILSPDRIRLDANILLGVAFSVSLGLAFLGIGLLSSWGRPDNEVRNLLWGSLAFCRWGDVVRIGAAAALTLLLLTVFGKELSAVMFSRGHAAAAGIHDTLVWTGFLVLAAIVLTVNFQTVGGLMIYSLMTNPAVGAFLLVRGHSRAALVSSLLGAFCGLGGFLLAACLDLPTGATTVLLSAAVVAAAFGASAWRARRSSQGLSG